MNTITANWLITIFIICKWITIGIIAYCALKLALFGVYKIACHGKLSLRAWWKRSKI